MRSAREPGAATLPHSVPSNQRLCDRRAATREQILKFLSSGTNNNNPETWYDKQNSDNSWFTVQCDGVFTDKEGKVYFWTLNNPETLTLLTSDGGQALLQLGK